MEKIGLCQDKGSGTHPVPLKHTAIKCLFSSLPWADSRRRARATAALTGPLCRRRGLIAAGKERYRQERLSSTPTCMGAALPGQPACLIFFKTLPPPQKSPSSQSSFHTDIGSSHPVLDVLPVTLSSSPHQLNAYHLPIPPRCVQFSLPDLVAHLHLQRSFSTDALRNRLAIYSGCQKDRGNKACIKVGVVWNSSFLCVLLLFLFG